MREAVGVAEAAIEDQLAVLERKGAGDPPAPTSAIA
jgi:hypothetical protein